MILEKNKKELLSIQTPAYFYDLGLLEQTLNAAKEGFEPFGYHVHYALKANSNEEILKLISSKGFGADCVSGNEVKRAVECGFASENIAFAGVGKSDSEIDAALSADIFSFNCESIGELEVLQERAAALNKTARIALRINPNVNAKTHEYITTGLEENKFGINMWELESVIDKIKSSPNIEFTGIHFHIGSQVTDLSVFKNLCNRVNEIQQWFIDNHLIPDHINVGGGLGIDYENPDENAIPDFKKFFGIFNDHLELRPKQSLHFELGRSLVAQCGLLVTEVLYVKNGINVDFAIVDAGMTELIRPALYQSYHKIEAISSKSSEVKKYDVVGPICESSDTFGKSVLLPEMSRGNRLVIRSVGAYGEVMSSSYNLRDKAEAYYAS